MANKKKKKRKQVFHAPQTVGERKKIPMTPLTWALSIASLAVQVGLTAFAIYALTVRHGEAATLNYGGIYLNNSLLYLALPIVMWLITLAIRLGLRLLPLDMWRMPADVRRGVERLEGRPLRLATLLVELATALTFLYVDVTIFLGRAPLDAVMLLWLAALDAGIYFPMRYAKRSAAQD
ncbi:MAG: hypothetical protein IJ751_01235 [Oscillospiraceae bacterium]|nr:hypothetical protein [Oscillospiraceae bacterium]